MSASRVRPSRTASIFAPGRLSVICLGRQSARPGLLLSLSACRSAGFNRWNCRSKTTTAGETSKPDSPSSRPDDRPKLPESPFVDVEDRWLHRNAGPMLLRIFRPKKTVGNPNRKTDPNAPAVILVLPSLPSEAADADFRTCSILASVAAVPVIRVGYRAGPTARFPSPSHDSIAVIDWVGLNFRYLYRQTKTVRQLSRFSPDASTQSVFYPRSKQVRVGIFGSGFGGSLGLSIAMTECHRRSGLSEARYPAIVCAAAVEDPVVDWGDGLLPEVIDEHLSSSPKQDDDKTVFPAVQFDNNEIQPTAELRQALFRHTGGVFDAYASPALHLRSPAYEEYTLPLPPDSPRYQRATVKLRPCRRIIRHFPPKDPGSDLSVPDTYIRISDRGVKMRESIDEFVGLLRRAVKESDFPTVYDDARESAKEKARQEKIAKSKSKNWLKLKARSRLVSFVEPDQDALATKLMRRRVVYVAPKLAKSRYSKSGSKFHPLDSSALAPTSPNDQIDLDVAQIVKMANWLGDRLRY